MPPVRPLPAWRRGGRARSTRLNLSRAFPCASFFSGLGSGLHSRLPLPSPSASPSPAPSPSPSPSPPPSHAQRPAAERGGRCTQASRRRRPRRRVSSRARCRSFLSERFSRVTYSQPTRNATQVPHKQPSQPHEDKQPRIHTQPPVPGPPRRTPLLLPLPPPLPPPQPPPVSERSLHSASLGTPARLHIPASVMHSPSHAQPAASNHAT